jgi:hypothetical protein
MEPPPRVVALDVEIARCAAYRLTCSPDESSFLAAVLNDMLALRARILTGEPVDDLDHIDGWNDAHDEHSASSSGDSTSHTDDMAGSDGN